MGDFGNGFTSYKVVYLTSQPKFEVIGDDSQVVNVSLGPHEKVFAEPGTFMHGSGQLKGDVECQPMCGCKAMLGGEAPLKIVYENDSEANGYIGLTPNFPAKVSTEHTTPLPPLLLLNLLFCTLFLSLQSF